MKKLLLFITAFFLLVGITTSANALQTAISHAEVDLDIEYGQNASAVGMGVVSGGAALAASSIDSWDADGYIYVDTYCMQILDDWASAYSAGTYAYTGIGEGEQFSNALYSEAGAYAGDGYGEESLAVAGNYANVSEVYVSEETTISLDYYLSGSIYGDTEYGYSEALSAAIFAVYSCGAGFDGDLELLDVATGYDSDAYGELGTLTLTLSEGFYTIFAGTAALAYATEATNPVPEPATMLLLGTGLIGLAGVGRKKIFKK